MMSQGLHSQPRGLATEPGKQDWLRLQCLPDSSRELSWRGSYFQDRDDPSTMREEAHSLQSEGQPETEEETPQHYQV